MKGIFSVNVTRTLARLTAAVGLSLVAASCSSGPRPVDDTESYARHIADKRAIKERFFHDTKNPENPVPADKQSEFLPLSYYAVDPDYRIPAALKVAPDQPVFDMPTSTGKMRKATQVGVLEFTVKGQPMALVAFAGEGPGGAPDMRRLFVPFSDLTSGTETYAAGRFLDLDRTATGIYVIDFNEAYSPYCAYNATYDCPFPPPANRLKVPVRVGERLKALSSGTPPPQG